jgi:hypothetical protein
MKLLAGASLAVLLCLADLPSFHAQEKKDEKKDEKKEDKEKALLEKCEYYPLRVGNVWKYKLGDSHFDMKVDRYEKVGEVLCARVNTLVDGRVIEFEHLAVTPDGIYRHSIGGKRPDKPVCILKLPPKKGEKWEVKAQIGEEKLGGDFAVGEAEVGVPAGKYSAVTSESRNLDVNGLKVSVTYYFAKDVGIVRQVIEVGPQKTDMQLEKFEPKAP